jgi:uncharacterized membrane protein
VLNFETLTTFIVADIEKTKQTKQNKEHEIVGLKMQEIQDKVKGTSVKKIALLLSKAETFVRLEFAAKAKEGGGGFGGGGHRLGGGDSSATGTSRLLSGAASQPTSPPQQSLNTYDVRLS